MSVCIASHYIQYRTYMTRRSNVLDTTDECIDIVNDGSSHYSSAEFSSKTAFASTVEASTNIEGGNVAVSVEASASFKKASSGSTSSTGVELSYVSCVMETSVHIYFQSFSPSLP